MQNDNMFIDGLRARVPPRPPTPLSTRSGETIVFVLDHSGSMGFDDYPPDRYRAAVDAVSWFIGERIKMNAEDRLGAVVFNSTGRVVCSGTPIAKAESDILRPLRRISPGNGTEIEAGLQLAGQLLPAATPERRQRIILLTDGHGGEPVELANQLKSRGILIDAIGIGGSPSDVHEEGLKKIASVIDGKVRYRFIANRADLLDYFKKIAGDLVQVRAR